MKEKEEGREAGGEGVRPSAPSGAGLCAGGLRESVIKVRVARGRVGIYIGIDVLLRAFREEMKRSKTKRKCAISTKTSLATT